MVLNQCSRNELENSMSMIRQFHNYRYFSVKKKNIPVQYINLVQAFFFKEHEHNCKHIFSVIESLKKDATLMYMYLLL